MCFALSKTKSDVFSKSPLMVRKPSLPPALKPDYRVISKRFAGEFCLSRRSGRLSPPLQALFMYALVIDLKLMYMIFESMCAVYTGIDDLNPRLAKLSLPFGVVLTLIFNHFNAPLHRFYSANPVLSPPLSNL